MSEALQAKVDRLEAENRVLREENLLLAEHAEEAMLLGTVAEVASWSDDSDILLNEVLERISILRDLPLCASGYIEGKRIILDRCYSSLSDQQCDVDLLVPTSFLSRLDGRNGCVVQLPSPGYHVIVSGSDICVSSLFLMTFNTHIMDKGIFLFASTDTSHDWSGSQLFFRHVIDIVAARLDRLDLIMELQRVNMDLDQRVRDRTLELENSCLELRQLQSLMENVINSMPSVLIGVDAKGQVLEWNQESERVSGCPAKIVKGQPLSQAFPAFARLIPDIEQAIVDKKPRNLTRAQLEYTDGSPFLADITVYPLLTNGVDGAVVRADDVTEKVRLEEVMVQAEKMLSVGGLAAGMAHEINNPLAGILQNLQVAQNRLTLPQPKNTAVAAQMGLSLEKINAYLEKRGILAMLDSASENGRRAAAIVENILSFSRQSESKKAPRDLAQVLEKTLVLLDNDYDLDKGYDFRKIEILRDFADDLPPVPCEETKIQQVLLNILRNGAQAMESAAASGPCCFRLKLSRHDEMAEISICDTGPGLSPEARRRIFEPFYTTKGTRGGVGLGLSVSYFIITEQHKGELLVEPAPEHGCCFILRLPFAAD